MKKKLISFILLASFVFATIPTHAFNNNETVAWHSCIQQDVYISWTLMRYDRTSGDIQIGEHQLEVGDPITYEIVDAPQTNATEIYGMDGPEFIQLWLYRDINVAWTDVTQPDFNILFPRLILPISYDLGNGTVLTDLEDIIHYIATFDAGIYFVNTNVIDADTIEAAYDTSFADITIKYNSHTGIARSFILEAPYGTGYFELDIFQSNIDDFGTQINNSILWHSSLVPGSSISWVLADLHSDEDHITLGVDNAGNEYNLWVDDDLTFAIVDTIPSNPDEVYGPNAPAFLQIYAGDQLVPFDAMDEGVGLTFQWILNPIGANLYNGTHLNFLDLVNLRLSFENTIINSHYSVNGDYLTLFCAFNWSEWDEGLNEEVPHKMNVTYTINMQTGILYSALFEDPDSGDYGYFVLDIWESYMDDYGVIINNELTWFNKLHSGTWLSWEITSVDIVDPDMTFELGDHNLTSGDYLRFKFIADIPTNPTEVYGGEHGPSFIQLYMNNKHIPWDDIEGPGGVFFQFLVLPLSLQLYNGTTLDIVDLLRLFDSSIDELTITQLTVDALTVDVTFHLEQHFWYRGDDAPTTEIVDFSYTIVLSTGITQSASVVVPGENGNNVIRLEFSTPYSTIDAEGNDNDQFTEIITTQTETPTSGPTGGNTLGIPGFTLLIAVIGIASILVISRKRK